MSWKGPKVGKGMLDFEEDLSKDCHEKRGRGLVILWHKYTLLGVNKEGGG